MAHGLNLPEALHSFSVTITEIQLQMTNGYDSVSAIFPWAVIELAYLKIAPLQVLLKSYEIKMVFPSLLLIFFW